MLVAVLAATAAAMPQAVPSSTPAASDKVVIEGWALSMGTVATGANQSIRITIDGWSNPQQRQLLISAFLEKKQDGLLRDLNVTVAAPQEAHAVYAAALSAYC